MKNEIVPHLFFDTQAVEAAEFYCSIFPHSTIKSRSIIRDTPSGDCDYLSFELWGKSFEAISAGPFFTFNPSISFMVNFDPAFFDKSEDPVSEARSKLTEVWNRLRVGGQTLMELEEYDFSPLYGWLQDKYGISWQLILTGSEGDPRPPIMLSMLFVGENCGKAEDAGDFYRSVFPSSMGMLVRYPSGMEPEKEGNVMFSDFQLGETWITAMDSADSHQFQFNEAVSFIVTCKNQTEIDFYWEKLSAVPEAEQCGWLKDKYGVSWQIVPEDLSVLMTEGTEQQIKAVTQASLKMKKFSIDELRQAHGNAL